MYKKNNIGLVCSVILHTCIFFYLLLPHISVIPEPMSNFSNESKSLTVRLIPKEQSPDKTEILKGNKSALSYPTDTKICSLEDKSYKGVGVIFSPSTKIVIYVTEYYPAYKAGMRVGDSILNDMKETDGYIDFEVRRAYTTLFFHIKTDNICYNDR